MTPLVALVLDAIWPERLWESEAGEHKQSKGPVDLALGVEFLGHRGKALLAGTMPRRTATSEGSGPEAATTVLGMGDDDWSEAAGCDVVGGSGEIGPA